VISVVRKGTGAIQELPASSDAFVWLRLYRVQMDGLIPSGRRQPLWWTMRAPFRPLPDRRLGQVEVLRDLADRPVTPLAQLHDLGLELGRERTAAPGLLPPCSP